MVFRNPGRKRACGESRAPQQYWTQLVSWNTAGGAEGLVGYVHRSSPRVSLCKRSSGSVCSLFVLSFAL